MRWVMLAAMGLVVAVLIAGVINMVRQPSNPRRSNKLMQWRVGLQFLVLMLFLVYWLLTRH